MWSSENLLFSTSGDPVQLLCNYLYKYLNLFISQNAKLRMGVKLWSVSSEDGTSGTNPEWQNNVLS